MKNLKKFLVVAFALLIAPLVANVISAQNAQPKKTSISA